jgi:acyl-CoA dehydrogenase
MIDNFVEEMPFFTNEQRNLAARVADFAVHQVEPRTEDEEESDVDGQFRTLFALLADAGLLRYAVASGGSKLDVRSLCLIREALSYSSSLADLAFVMQGLGTYAISRAATEHVREFWLERAATGRAIAAFALTEPDAGSDVAGIQTLARSEGDWYVIDGR